MFSISINLSGADAAQAATNQLSRVAKRPLEDV
jgi:hypothetical protein